MGVVLLCWGCIERPSHIHLSPPILVLPFLSLSAEPCFVFCPLTSAFLFIPSSFSHCDRVALWSPVFLVFSLRHSWLSTTAPFTPLVPPATRSTPPLYRLLYTTSGARRLSPTTLFFTLLAPLAHQTPSSSLSRSFHLILPLSIATFLSHFFTGWRGVTSLLPLAREHFPLLFLRVWTDKLVATCQQTSH